MRTTYRMEPEKFNIFTFFDYELKKSIVNDTLFMLDMKINKEGIK